MPSTKRNVDIAALKQQLDVASANSERLDLHMMLGETLAQSAPEEAIPHLVSAQALAESAGISTKVARAASLLAEIHLNAGRLKECERHTHTVLTAARASKSIPAEASAVNLMGKTAQAKGDYGQAKLCYEQSLEMSLEASYQVGVQSASNQLGSLHDLMGKPAEALAWYRRSLESDRRLEDLKGEATSLYNIGLSLAKLGRWEEATQSLTESKELSLTHGLRDRVEQATNILGELYLKRNELDKAAAEFMSIVEAESVRKQNQPVLCDAMANLGLTHLRAGEYGAAARVLADAEKVCVEAGDKYGLVTVLWRRAKLALAEGRLSLCEEVLDRADKLARDHDLKPEQGQVLRLRALLRDSLGKRPEARDLFEQAIRSLSEAGDTYELAQARLQYGSLLCDAGDWKAASPLLDKAAAAFRRLGVVAESQQANDLLFKLQMRTDREAALVRSLTGLNEIGLEPVSFFEQALARICEALEFDSGAVLLDDRPVVSLRAVDNAEAVTLCRSRQLVVSPLRVCIPVKHQGRILGSVFVQRKSAGVAVDARTLERLPHLLSDALYQLSELPGLFQGTKEIEGLVFRGVVGTSPAMIDALKTVARTAAGNVPVLILGESGTGKELVARAIHDSGSRREGRFVAVNCAAVPENLLEAEFFGVVKGAATGVKQREGRFAFANRGTLLLDEIGDMSLGLQSKLLRVLEQHEFVPVGANRPVRTDARVVAATNQDLLDMMKRKLFREDLFHRLQGVEIRLPALRDRREDIPDFVRFFVARSRQEFAKDVLGPDPATLKILVAYDWPGNIRELQKTIEQAVLLAPGRMLTPADLPRQMRRATAMAAAPLGAELARSRRDARLKRREQDERELIEESLSRAGGDTALASQFAGYSRPHFYRLMRRHGIQPPKRRRT
jgi:DNA-binding NtrC family response regulator/tetratricopeptide (TPR) repeat protein